MSVYLCRRPNGDIFLICDSNRLAIDEVLDEVGKPFNLPQEVRGPQNAKHFVPTTPQRCRELRRLTMRGNCGQTVGFDVNICHVLSFLNSQLLRSECPNRVDRTAVSKSTRRKEDNK